MSYSTINIRYNIFWWLWSRLNRSLSFINSMGFDHKNEIFLNRFAFYKDFLELLVDDVFFPRNGRVSRILHLDQRIKNYLLYTVGCVFVATGSLTCVHQKQFNGHVYLIVFNNDQNTPDEVTRFRFTCYVSSCIGSIQVM